MISQEEIINIIKNKHRSLHLIESPISQPAINYKIDNYKGKIGIISSMTNPFCDSCNRIRLTADGNLKVCLHDDTEVSLRNLIRENKTDEDIMKVINNALLDKKEAHDGMENLEKSKNRPMIKIGG